MKISLLPRHARRFLAGATALLMLTGSPFAAAADALRPNERAFVEKALEASRQQLLLAEIAAGHASSTDVRSHALQLTADYRELSATLDALIRRKGGIAGAPAGGTSENYQRLTTRAGADFDREFVRTSAELSEGVMRLFEQTANDAKDADIREFASARLPLLRDHLNRSLELRKVFD